MTSAVIHLLAAKGAAGGIELPVPPLAIGIGVFVVFVVLLALTASFGKDR